MSSRNSIQIAGMAAALLLTGSGFFGVFLQLEAGLASGSSLLFQLLLASEGLFAVSASLFLMLFFRSTPSPEVYFFILAIQACSFGALRPLIDALISTGSSYMLPALLTRAFYFGRFLFIISLFFSGLFAAGLALQRRAIMLSTTFFVSFIFAAIIPVDISSYTRLLLFSVGAKESMFIGYFILSVLSVGNFLIAALHQGNRSHYLIALGVLLAIAGKQLIFLSGEPVQITAGLICLGAGTYFFGSRTHRIYLWL